MKNYRLPQIYATVSVVLIIIYFFVITSDIFSLIDLLKMLLFAIFCIAMIIFPDRYSKFFSIPLFLYLLLTVLSIYIFSQSYQSYLSDYIIEYVVEFSFLITMMIGLFKSNTVGNIYKVVLWIIMIASLVIILFKALIFVALDEYEYIWIHLTYTLPEVLIGASVLTFVSKRYQQQ